MTAPLGIWFPTVRARTGVDAFTERMVYSLQRRGIRAEISWLPHRAEYLPWTVPVPSVPTWADVAHINSWLPGRFVPGHLPVVTTLHSCVHDPALDPYKSALQRIYHGVWVRRCEQRNMVRAAAVTAVSEYTAHSARTAFGQAIPIDAIPNGIDIAMFSPGDPKPAPHEPFRLLFVGKPSRRKGADLLGPIMAELGRDFELLVTCDEAELVAIGRCANMRALGHLDAARLLDAYRSCDAVLFPSRLEGLSLACLEAHSCAVPIIATDASSMPEIVVDGETGYLCPRDDVGAFVQAAIRLRNDRRLWVGMRLAARRRAEALFSEECMTDRYVEIYRRICGRPI